MIHLFQKISVSFSKAFSYFKPFINRTGRLFSFSNGTRNEYKSKKLFGNEQTAISVIGQTYGKSTFFANSLVEPAPYNCSKQTYRIFTSDFKGRQFGRDSILKAKHCTPAANITFVRNIPRSKLRVNLDSATHPAVKKDTELKQFWDNLRKRKEVWEKQCLLTSNESQKFNESDVEGPKSLPPPRPKFKYKFRFEELGGRNPNMEMFNQAKELDKIEKIRKKSENKKFATSPPPSVKAAPTVTYKEIMEKAQKVQDQLNAEINCLNEDLHPEIANVQRPSSFDYKTAKMDMSEEEDEEEDEAFRDVAEETKKSPARNNKSALKREEERKRISFKSSSGLSYPEIVAKSKQIRNAIANRESTAKWYVEEDSKISTLDLQRTDDSSQAEMENCLRENALKLRKKKSKLKMLNSSSESEHGEHFFSPTARRNKASRKLLCVDPPSGGPLYSDIWDESSEHFG